MKLPGNTVDCFNYGSEGNKIPLEAQQYKARETLGFRNIVN